MKRVNKLLTRIKPFAVITICGLGVFASLKLADFVHERFTNLPIEGTHSFAKAEKIKTEFENLPALFAQAVQKKDKASFQDSPVDIDAAFLPPETPRIEKNIITDKFVLLPKAVVVGGVSDHGAVLKGGAIPAGEYVAFGGEIHGFAYPDRNGKMVTPILSRKSNKALIIKEPTRRGREVRIPI